jgi:hypothetical protein
MDPNTVWLILELSSTAPWEGSGTFLSVHGSPGAAILHLFQANTPHYKTLLASDEVRDGDGALVSVDFTCVNSCRTFRVQGAGVQG